MQLKSVSLPIRNDHFDNPIVLEKSKENVVGFDIFSKLLTNRIIFLGDEIDDTVANVVVAELLYLDSISNDPICLYINSPGGIISAGMAILDTMHYVKSPVNTLCIGQAASMAAILLAAGAHRSALPHSRVLIHQPLGGSAGQASDIQIAAKEIARIKDIVNKLLSDFTGKSVSKIAKDSDRDYWMSAEEALNYGIIDEII